MHRGISCKQMIELDQQFHVGTEAMRQLFDVIE